MSSHLLLPLPMHHFSGTQRHLFVGGFLLEGTELQVKMAQLLLPHVVLWGRDLTCIVLAWVGLNFIFLDSVTSSLGMKLS